MSITKVVQERYRTSKHRMDCDYCSGVIGCDDRYLHMVIIYSNELFINTVCNTCADVAPINLIENEWPELDTTEANTVIIWALEKLAHGKTGEQKLARHVMEEYGL